MDNTEHKFLDNLEITPRGFLGNSLGESVKIPLGTFSKTTTVGPDANNFAGRITIPNPNVDKVMNEYVNKPLHCANFGFVVDVIEIAIHAFGTSNFTNWYVMQHKSPVTTDLHIRFLNETIDFILTGERKTNVFTWLNLLACTENTGNYTLVDNNILAKIEKGGIKTIKELLIVWLRKENGLNDLVMTLFILFGSVQK